MPRTVKSGAQREWSGSCGEHREALLLRHLFALWRRRFLLRSHFRIDSVFAEDALSSRNVPSIPAMAIARRLGLGARLTTGALGLLRSVMKGTHLTPSECSYQFTLVQSLF